MIFPNNASIIRMGTGYHPDMLLSTPEYTSTMMDSPWYYGSHIEDALNMGYKNSGEFLTGYTTQAFNTKTFVDGKDIYFLHYRFNDDFDKVSQVVAKFNGEDLKIDWETTIFEDDFHPHYLNHIEYAKDKEIYQSYDIHVDDGNVIIAYNVMPKDYNRVIADNTKAAVDFISGVYFPRFAGEVGSGHITSTEQNSIKMNGLPRDIPLMGISWNGFSGFVDLYPSGSFLNDDYWAVIGGAKLEDELYNAIIGVKGIDNSILQKIGSETITSTQFKLLQTFYPDNLMAKDVYGMNEHYYALVDTFDRKPLYDKIVGRVIDRLLASDRLSGRFMKQESTHSINNIEYHTYNRQYGGAGPEEPILVDIFPNPMVGHPPIRNHYLGNDVWWSGCQQPFSSWLTINTKDGKIKSKNTEKSRYPKTLGTYDCTATHIFIVNSGLVTPEVKRESTPVKWEVMYRPEIYKPYFNENGAHIAKTDCVKYLPDFISREDAVKMVYDVNKIFANEFNFDYEYGDQHLSFQQRHVFRTPVSGITRAERFVGYAPDVDFKSVASPIIGNAIMYNVSSCGSIGRDYSVRGFKFIKPYSYNNPSFSNEVSVRNYVFNDYGGTYMGYMWQTTYISGHLLHYGKYQTPWYTEPSAGPWDNVAVDNRYTVRTSYSLINGDSYTRGFGPIPNLAILNRLKNRPYVNTHLDDNYSFDDFTYRPPYSPGKEKIVEMKKPWIFFNDSGVASIINHKFDKTEYSDFDRYNSYIVNTYDRKLSEILGMESGHMSNIVYWPNNVLNPHRQILRKASHINSQGKFMNGHIYRFFEHDIHDDITHTKICDRGLAKMRLPTSANERLYAENLPIPSGASVYDVAENEFMMVRYGPNTNMPFMGSNFVLLDNYGNAISGYNLTDFAGGMSDVLGVVANGLVTLKDFGFTDDGFVVYCQSRLLFGDSFSLIDALYCSIIDWQGNLRTILLNSPYKIATLPPNNKGKTYLVDRYTESPISTWTPKNPSSDLKHYYDLRMSGVCPEVKDEEEE